MDPRTRALIFTLAAAFSLSVGTASAQSRIVSVRVYPDADGAIIRVDGVEYNTPITVFWPEGSKHTVYATPVQKHVSQTLFTFGGWSTNLGPLQEPTITVDRSLTWVRASFAKSYAFRLSYLASCAEISDTCPAGSPGIVYMNGERLTGSAERYYLAGSTVTLEAYPNPGFVFDGWGQVPGEPANNAYMRSFVLTRPMIVSPLFRPAVRVGLRIATAPPALKILADRLPMIAPASVEWGLNTVHSLGTYPTQYDDHGRLWVFDSWSDGGGINHDINVSGPPGQTTMTQTTITAKFVPGAVVTFLTEPAGLKLSIENRQIWPSYTFQWAAGTTHRISAPLEQTDAKGRKYRFQGWSDGQAAAFDYTVAAAPADVRLMAVYKAVGQITLSSNPAGMQMQVDGQPCAAPCSIERDLGAVVRVSAPEVYSPNDASRLVFQGWSDTGSAEHEVAAPDVPLRLEASYKEQNRLAVALDPSDAGLCNISPEMPDGFYDKGTLVTVQIKVTPGNRFLAWAGDTSGTRPNAVVEMNAPKRILARLESVPYIEPAGVRNGAAETPVEGVAPGSIISIVGVHLAPTTESVRRTHWYRPWRM